MGKAIVRRSPSVQIGKRRARKVRLVYVNDFEKGIRRERRGTSFRYLSSGGKAIQSERTLRRIDALAIPPAWKDVWIASQSNGHIQATGRDAAGRKQYIYHERWNAISCETKYDRMHLMAKLLPRIRRRVRRDLKRRELTQERVVAAVVRLIDKSHLRIGNEQYAEEHGTRGATTLTRDHVEVKRFKISLEFPGKSGQMRERELEDSYIAKVLRQCEGIRGQFLFCYLDEDDQPHRIESTHVNEYLYEITGESITAKDFRTWWGSVIALSELKSNEGAETSRQRKRAVAAAVAAAAEDLGNTKTVCRQCYIHPGILSAAEMGELATLISKAGKNGRTHAELTVDESLLARLLPHLEFESRGG